MPGFHVFSSPGTFPRRVDAVRILPRPDAPDDPSPEVSPAWPSSVPRTPPNVLHSAPVCHSPGRSRHGHAVVPGCPPCAARVRSIYNIFHEAENHLRQISRKWQSATCSLTFVGYEPVPANRTISALQSSSGRYWKLPIPIWIRTDCFQLNGC